MLKEYSERVRSTYDLMITIIQQAGLNAKELLAVRKRAIENTIQKDQFPLRWQIDTSKYSMITLKGYEAGSRISDATNLPVLYYDHNKPFTRQVKFFDVFDPEDIIEKPVAYIIPQGWWAVVDLLKLFS